VHRSIKAQQSHLIEGLCETTEYVPQYQTEKITRKASDASENPQLYRVVRFFRPRMLWTTTHLMLFSERLLIYASGVTISGGRTEQHVVIGFGELAAVD